MAATKEYMITVTFSMTLAMLEAISAEAERRGMTRSEWIRRVATEALRTKGESDEQRPES